MSIRVRYQQTTASRLVGGALYWLLLPLWGPCRVVGWCCESLFDYAASRDDSDGRGDYTEVVP